MNNSNIGFVVLLFGLNDRMCVDYLVSVYGYFLLNVGEDDGDDEDGGWVLFGWICLGFYWLVFISA